MSLGLLFFWVGGGGQIHSESEGVMFEPSWAELFRTPIAQSIPAKWVWLDFWRPAPI